MAVLVCPSSGPSARAAGSRRGAASSSILLVCLLPTCSTSPLSSPTASLALRADARSASPLPSRFAGTFQDFGFAHFSCGGGGVARALARGSDVAASLSPSFAASLALRAVARSASPLPSRFAGTFPDFGFAHFSCGGGGVARAFARGFDVAALLSPSSAASLALRAVARSASPLPSRFAGTFPDFGFAHFSCGGGGVASAPVRSLGCACITFHFHIDTIHLLLLTYLLIITQLPRELCFGGCRLLEGSWGATCMIPISPKVRPVSRVLAL